MNAAMSSSMRESFPTGRTLAKNLTGIARAVAAEKLLTNDLPVSGSVVVLPQFGVVDFNGTESINRIQWDGGKSTLLVPDDSTVSVAWRIEDSTLPTQTGTITIAPAVDGHSISGEWPVMVIGTEPAVLYGATAAALSRHLTKISAQGNLDLFELVRYLVPYTRKAVDSAARKVFREIHNLPAEADSKVIPVIDSVEADVVVDRLLYGDEGKTSSVVTRLLRRAASTDAVVRKSVIMFVSKAIWSSAETNVRAAIGDPHAGRVIRRLARLIQSTDPHIVLDAYRNAHPTQQMGIGRVEAALSAGATIGARQATLDAGLPDDVGGGAW